MNQAKNPECQASRVDMAVEQCECYPNAQQLDGKHLTDFVSKGSQSRKGTEGGPSKGKKEKGHKNVSEVD